MASPDSEPDHMQFGDDAQQPNPNPQGQQQPQRLQTLEPAQQPAPLNRDVPPTPAQAARKAASKRKRDTSADDDADRVEQIRALVLRANNEHLTTAVVPFEERPKAANHTNFHVAFWSGNTAPCVVNALPNFAVQPRGVTLEDALAFNKSAPHWLNILRAAQGNPLATTGYACLLQLTDQVVTKENVGEIRADLQEAAIRTCHMPSIIVIAPTFSDDARDGHPLYSPTAFLATNISLEAVHTFCAKYAFNVSWEERRKGISFNVLGPDIAPPTLIGTFENLRNLPPITPELEKIFLAKIRAHVVSRFPGIEDFLRSNNAEVWGGGQVEPWWAQLLYEAIRIKVWQSTGRDGKPEAQITVYVLGVFAGKFLHTVWEEKLLGGAVDMGEFGIFKRTATEHKSKCLICRDREHHARICTVWNHPAWPEELRVRRQEQIKADKETRAGSGSSARGGRGGSRGAAPLGRGAPIYYAQPPPPPPPTVYYAPAYGYGYDAPPQRGRGGGRGRGRGRGGRAGW